MTARYPVHLYKFRHGGSRDIENLSHQKIWLPSFENLNDPHDGQLDIAIDHAVRMHGLFSPVVIHDASGAPIFVPFSIGTTAHDDRHTPEVEERYTVEVKQLQAHYRKTGIYSLSENVGSPQMWAHYANNSKGFCIEYSTRDSAGTLFPMCEYISKVQYIDDYPNIDLKILHMSTESRRLFELLGRKERRWEYECEWRWLCSQGDVLIQHPLPISSIIFGPKTSTRNIDAIQEIFDRTDVKMKQAVKQPRQFELGVEAL